MEQTPTTRASLLSPGALPVPTELPAATGKPPKHFLAAFFLSFFLGVFGADRFYLGLYFSGTLKLLTFGLFGIGAIVDLALIMNNALRDSRGRLPVGYDEYKGLARRTVLWITLGGLTVLIVSAAATAFTISQLLSHYDLSHFDPTSLTNAGSGSGGAGSETVPSVNSLLNI